jgi:uncharacterized membrane protein
MFDLPLHPLIVHFPMVLAAVLPLAALAALAAGFRYDKRRKYWAAVLIVNALLFGSSLLAVRTGERDEDKVEKVLASEAPLETHEENAGLFVKSTGAALAVSAMGLLPGAFGMSGRIIGGLASIALLFLGFQVGHSGGKLVYAHGATAAFTTGQAAGADGKPVAVSQDGRGEAEKEVGQNDEDD